VALRYLRARAPRNAELFGLPAGRDHATRHDALLAAIQDLAMMRLYGHPRFETTDAMVAKLLLYTPPPGLQIEYATALRLVIAFGERSREEALRTWLSALLHLWSSSAGPSLSLTEARALAPYLPPLEQLFPDATSRAAGSWFGGSRAPRPPGRRLADSTVEKMLLVALEAAQNDGTRGRSALRRFAAARDEDWLTPVAYAAWRACKGVVPRGVSDLVASQQERGAEAEELTKRGGRWEGEVLLLLRRADEASSLAEVAALFLRDDAKSDDLRFLLARHAEWRERVDAVLRE